SADTATNEPRNPTTGIGALNEELLLELDKHAYTPHFVVDVVDSFESDMLDLIERLHAAVEAEDWSEIAEIRHAIERTAGGSGAAGIVEFIPVLKSLRAVEAVERFARVAQLRSCFAATRDAMREFLSKRTPKPRRVRDQAESVTPPS